MSASQDANFKLLKTLFPFYLLPETVLAQIAVSSIRRVFIAGESVFTPGEPANALHIIISGTVRLRGKQKKNTKDLAFLNRGDLFGLEALSRDHEYSTLALCDTRAVIQTIQRETLFAASSEDATLQRALNMLRRSHAFSRDLDLAWLSAEEPVVLVSRRHPFILISRILLWGSLALLFFGLFLYLAFTSASSSSFFIFLAILFLCSGLGVAAWSALEWSNDYLIVTHRRVTLQQQMVGFYEGRQESPWDAVLSIGMDSSVWSRMIGYGTVTVRSYTGDLHLERLPEPDLIYALLEWTRERVANERRRDDRARIREALAARLENRSNPDMASNPRTWVGNEDSMYQSGSFSDFLARFSICEMSAGGASPITHTG
jgi:CRP-like cAMP-binding protein